ncbi:hypothetical protein K402DRAFT_298903, partial [Aulographum hederae CBS 113979]
RHILRECTYLPDPAARIWTNNHVRARFRASDRDFAPSLLDARREKWLEDARRAVLYCRRANDGDPKPLKRILMMTYGRIGKRKHLLLRTLQQPDRSTAPDGDGPFKIEGKNQLEFRISPRFKMLQALTTSQVNNTFYVMDKPSSYSPPHVTTRIPSKNMWGRDMPRRRVKNSARKWYAGLLNFILPPLPIKEWERLEGLATGTLKWDGPVPRRSRRNALPSPLTARDLKAFVRKSPIDLGGQESKTPMNITGRIMRRLWADVFSQCPKMTFDVEEGVWRVAW